MKFKTARILSVAIATAVVTALAQFGISGHVNVFVVPIGAFAGVLAGAILLR